MKKFSMLKSVAVSTIAVMAFAPLANGASKPSAEDKSQVQSQTPKGWLYCATEESNYETFTDRNENHSGKSCGTLRSVVANPKPFGNLMQMIKATDYVGKRLRMSAWVKTKLKSGTGQLWLRIDPDGAKGEAQAAGCFDNMDDRPIRGNTDWTKYELVVQLRPNSTDIAFGLMLIGKGQVWLDDVTFEQVGPEVPLTGKYVSGAEATTKPDNLNFEE
ncbi:MAG: hypothetical protein IT343_24705 [Candidatus Melainabacteria bacterium]|nr:hypothetical protein [Candidatus Melainabacteria bacterium]